MPDLLVKRLIPATSYKSGEVCIFHPGYFDQEPLLRLIGYDDTEGGIWREVAETACAIISNNASEGVLKNQDGVVMQQNILTPGHYWWHLPGKRSSNSPRLFR